VNAATTSRARLGDALDAPTGIAGGRRVALPAGFGACWADYAPLGDGLTLVRSQYCPSSDLAEEAAQGGAGTTLVVTFGLAGESGYVARRGPALRFRAGHTTLAAFTSSAGERRVNAGAAVRQLRLVLAPPSLERYLGEAVAARFARRAGIEFLGERATAPWCRALLQPLLTLEALSPVDRQIAALTLAAEALRPLGADSPSAPQGLDFQTIDKLNRARDLMRAHLDRRLTIPYLCMTVGLNEHAFKHGFRDLFGLPPARYLLQLRMQRAWTLLASGARVSQAAYAAGYEHPANFSAAFARHFGRTPRSVFGKERQESF
jgi:AraC-like DNA-binding protein